MIEWILQRNKESNGFLSKRIIFILAGFDLAIYGSSFIQDFGTFKRYIHPKDIVFLPNKPLNHDRAKSSRKR